MIWPKPSISLIGVIDLGRDVVIFVRMTGQPLLIWIFCVGVNLVGISLGREVGLSVFQ